MRWLIVMLIGVIATLAIFQIQLSLGPGLSAKNAVLYALIFGLTFRAALRGLPAAELPGLHAVFGAWVAYAITTWLIAALVIKYPYYTLIPNGITVKAEMLDSFLFFIVAFHALSDDRDVRTVMKALAAAVGAANVATLADLVGIVHLGLRVGATGAEEGRVFGVFGHANDTASLIVCLLPLSVVVMLQARGFMRAVWGAGALASLAVLLLTVSRGAYVGVVLGSIWAAWLCRGFIPLQKIAMWAFGGFVALIVGVLVGALAIPGAAQLISARLLGGGISADEMSSGRTVLWKQVFGKMWDQPITLLTGYGWDVYWVMPFRFATHNYYLYQWFSLGLVGLGCFILLITLGVKRAKRAAAQGHSSLRDHHVAFVFAMLMLAVSVFFVNMEGQWALVWIYFGVAMRATQIDLVPVPAKSRAQEPVIRPVLPLPPRPSMGGGGGRLVGTQLR
jgi:O-antigen ligase